MNGKLIDGSVQYAPNSITKRYNPYPEEMQIADGYKPVIDTPMPDPVEGYIWVSHWEELEDNIARVWEKQESEPEPTLEDRVDNLEQNVSDIINGVSE